MKWIPCSSRGKLDTNGHAAARHFCLITRTAWRWGRCWRPLAFRGPYGISIESTTRRRTHCRTKRSTYRNSGGPRRDGERRGDRTRTKEQRRHAFNFYCISGRNKLFTVFMLTNCTQTQIESNTDIRAVPYGRRWDKLFVVDSNFSFIFCLVSFGLLWHLNIYVP